MLKINLVVSRIFPSTRCLCFWIELSQARALSWHKKKSWRKNNERPTEVIRMGKTTMRIRKKFRGVNIVCLVNLHFRNFNWISKGFMTLRRKLNNDKIFTFLKLSLMMLCYTLQHHLGEHTHLSWLSRNRSGMIFYFLYYYMNLFFPRHSLWFFLSKFHRAISSSLNWSLISQLEYTQFILFSSASSQQSEEVLWC